MLKRNEDIMVSKLAIYNRIRAHSLRIRIMLECIFGMEENKYESLPRILRALFPIGYLLSKA